jgi:ectoine hydroxylase-related dioxygenase (phytanoyl-CoA dioxygenase family)
MTTLPNIDHATLKADFERDGYALVRGLFSSEEVNEIKETFERLHEAQKPTYITDDIRDPSDPLYQWPRIIHPHRFDKTALHYLLHPAVRECLITLFGEEPVAPQSMYYFKPPGSRGQAMHQDNLYLLVEPGTCIAAWTAIDRCDRENGGMMVVPKTHQSEIVCPEVADESESWARHLVRPPKGSRAIDVPMEPGDTLFFNGSTIHGSGPNRSKDRFRRSFIGHYAAGSLEKISKFYFPLVNMDGTEHQVEANLSGGPCGVSWLGEEH